MTHNLTAHYEEKYGPLTESRRSALKQIKRASQKIESEEDSDDDMYTRNIQIKEKGKYDILMYICLF